MGEATRSRRAGQQKDPGPRDPVENQKIKLGKYYDLDCELEALPTKMETRRMVNLDFGIGNVNPYE